MRSRQRSRSPAQIWRTDINGRSRSPEMDRYMPQKNLRSSPSKPFLPYRDPARGVSYRPHPRSRSRPSLLRHGRELQQPEDYRPTQGERLSPNAARHINHTWSSPRHDNTSQYPAGDYLQRRTQLRSRDVGARPEHQTSYERYRPPSPRPVVKSAPLSPRNGDSAS